MGTRWGRRQLLRGCGGTGSSSARSGGDGTKLSCPCRSLHDAAWRQVASHRSIRGSSAECVVQCSSKRIARRTELNYAGHGCRPATNPISAWRTLRKPVDCRWRHASLPSLWLRAASAWKRAITAGARPVARRAACGALAATVSAKTSNTMPAFFCVTQSIID